MFSNPVILFDGVCNLCNGAVNVTIKQDKKAVFRFASLQSETAQRLLQQYGVLKTFDSFVLIENGKLFQKSIAALRVLNKLPWYWKWTQLFWIIPKAARDALYDIVAKNRYKWFGKKDACMMPTPELKSRFLK